MLPRAVGARVATLLLGAPPPPDHLSAVLAQSRAVQGDAGLLLLLRSMDPLLWYSDDWRPLFRDWKDGQSFGALVGGTMHYGGPALLVVRTADGHLVGAVSSSWRELNGKFGGGADCFLFSVTPTLQVMRGSGRSQNYMYFNSKNRHAPRGIGFGGQAEMCRLWLDSDFERCHVLESDATYQEGRLLPGDDYQIPLECACVEVWGCGGAEAAEAQGEQRSRDQGLRDQARKVDRARMLETEFDKEVLFEKAFAKGSASKHTDQC
ncbi:unnamed protein product [Prorocentrum cordatum]|uniref:TLDc domain-containing protein n=1 Tax=Prorocentrum cordatum TaxID=2364126 RepID=A0ABN9TQB5_9DINO|nr:unnamed protein product [Polarella glacialis]